MIRSPYSITKPTQTPDQKRIAVLEKQLRTLTDYLITIPDMVARAVFENKPTDGPKGDIGIQGEQGYIGEQGPQGKDGYTPIKGLDYFDGKPGPKGDRGLRGLPGAKGKDGEDGKDVSPDEVIALLKEKKLLKPEHIQGLMEEITSYRTQLAGKHYGEDTWARGGGDTVAAGSGITITSSGGVKTIAASGSGFTLTEETPTGTVNASNVTFTVLHTPVFVEIDGTLRTSGNGYSYAAGTITVNSLIPPVQNIRSFYLA